MGYFSMSLHMLFPQSTCVVCFCLFFVFLGVADNALFFPCCDVYVVFSVLVFRSVAVHVFFVKLLQNSRFLEVIVCGLCFLCC